MAGVPTGEFGSLLSVLRWPLPSYMREAASCPQPGQRWSWGIVIDSNTAQTFRVLRAGIAHLISHKPNKKPNDL